MNDIECRYIDDCTGHPLNCPTCRHNTSKKKNYYEPETAHVRWVNIPLEHMKERSMMYGESDAPIPEVKKKNLKKLHKQSNLKEFSE